jgi:hypothetical protein
LIQPALSALAACGIAAAAAQTNVFEDAAWTTPETQVDRLAFRPLSARGIRPAPCSDAVFVRRVYLDVIGTLPTAAEARAFILDKSADKRAALVAGLLDREEFADYWAMKWSDLLRVKAEFPVNLWPNAAQAYHRWIWASIRDNKPYDRFVREMLTANGSNFRVGPVNFYRAMQDRTPEGIAATVALTFMGTRADRWPTNRLAGMAAFFSQVSYKPTREWKEEIVFWDPDREIARAAAAAQQAAASAPPKPATNAPAKAAANPATNTPAPAATAAAAPAGKGPPCATFPDGRKIRLDRDPREVFADWLITPKNPWFTLNIVNRVWSWLLGRGMIHEPDDIRPDNPPANPALLAWLQKEFATGGYDMKLLYRLILTSRAYQVSCIPPAPGAPGIASYPLRQLDAEVLIDAVNKVTGTSDLYTSPIPEPYTFIPENKPAIALPDGSITSAFLELFGHPARATGMDNERVNRPSPAQRMHLLNSSHIQRKLQECPALRPVMDPARKPQQIAEDLYLAVLSRFPTPDEMKKVDAYAKTGVAKGREAWVDLVWALVNSDEFLYRH